MLTRSWWLPKGTYDQNRIPPRSILLSILVVVINWDDALHSPICRFNVSEEFVFVVASNTTTTTKKWLELQVVAYNVNSLNEKYEYCFLND